MRMYRRQLDALTEQVSRAQLPIHPERAASLAKMGEREDEKIMLALLPLWVNEPIGDMPASLSKSVEHWLENTRNPAMRKLRVMTRDKRQEAPSELG